MTTFSKSMTRFDKQARKPAGGEGDPKPKPVRVSAARIILRDLAGE